MIATIFGAVFHSYYIQIYTYIYFYMYTYMYMLSICMYNLNTKQSYSICTLLLLKILKLDESLYLWDLCSEHYYTLYSEHKFHRKFTFIVFYSIMLSILQINLCVSQTHRPCHFRMKRFISWFLNKTKQEFSQRQSHFNHSFLSSSGSIMTSSKISSYTVASTGRTEKVK